MPLPNNFAHTTLILDFQVRNCSVNTLFSCIIGLGDKFTTRNWQSCINNTIFGILDEIDSRGPLNNIDDNIVQNTQNKSDTNRYKVAVHHSRDSSSKQWVGTQVLMLRGIERVLRQFFNHIIETVSQEDNSMTHVGDVPILLDVNKTNGWWFDSAWSRILNLAFKCSITIGNREVLDVREAGIELLIMMCQISSKRGLTATNSIARVGTNMQVVDGTLKTVLTTVENGKVVGLTPVLEGNESTPIISLQQQQILKSPHLQACRYKLFLRAFAIVEQFHGQLTNSKIRVLEDDAGQLGFSETVLLQVLVKLVQGLLQVYECCKGNEMSSLISLQSSKKNDNIEGRFVSLVSIVMKKANNGDQGSKHLT